MNLSSLPKSTINLVTSFPSEYVGTVGKLALAALQPNPQNLSRLLDKFSSEKKIPKEELYEVVGVYMAVIKYFIHTTDKDFASNLVEFGFPTEFVNNLSFVNNRKALVNNYLAPHYDYFYNVDSIKWRIDMSLLSSTMIEKTSPNVVLVIKLKEGKLLTIELNGKTFHMLRFNVALILREIKSIKFPN